MTSRHDPLESIDLPRVAACEARVRHFGEAHREEVVLRSGHDLARYEAAHRDVSRAITAEAAAQESTSLAESYSTTFVAERRRLKDESPAIETLGALPVAPSVAAPQPAAPEPGAVPASPAPTLSPAPRDLDPPPEPRFVPSYLREAASPASVPLAPAGAPVPVALPVMIPPAVARPEVVAIHLAEIDLTGPDSTQLPIRRPGPTLPFAEARPGEIPAAVLAASAAARTEREAGDAGGATEGEEPRREGAVDIDETAFLPRTVFEGPATPFERRSGQALPPLAPTRPSSGERSDDERARFEKKQVESAATMALDGDALRAAAATPEPWIPLEEYASFLGELAQDPSRAGFLRAKYGIAGEDAQRALGAGFAARFAREPGLRARFDALVATERARGRR